MDEQLNLESWLEQKDKSPIENTTCIVKEGQCLDLTWNDLFDAKEFDTLTCVTYVSSASFLQKAVGDYKKVSIILGIEKENVRKSFSDGINDRIHNKGQQFFDAMTDEGKNKLINGELEVKYSLPNCVIHSKFYLLSSSVSDRTRLILGSANLTNTAFDNSIRQFEDVLVYDDSPMFDIYKKRFEHILKYTEDYVPREICDKYREGKIISVANLTSEEQTENLLDALQKNNLIPIFNDVIMESLQESQIEETKDAEQKKATFEIINALSKKPKGDKTGRLVMKSGTELEKAKGTVTDILFKRTKSEAIMERFALTFNDADKKQYRIFQSKEDEKRDPELFDREASDEEITSSIKNMLRFLDAYRRFVTDQTEDPGKVSRIFEVLLYSFMSAYVFELRKKAPGGKSDIPIILVIGGRAFSGKSNLLAYIDKILSGRQLENDRHYLAFKDADKGGHIGDLFLSDNTYPLLVDEAPPAFFNSKASNKGEELIKYLSNTLEGKHPVMICTTNTASFSIPSQVIRRIYFLKVDACFDEKIRTEASEYYDSVMAEANNILFRDFCFRMSEKIKTNDNLFSVEGFDYLYVAREIFREYFKIAGVEKPSYFPESLYRDYDARGMLMWKTLFSQETDKFKFDKDGQGRGEPTYTINIKDLVPGNKDTQTYINYIRPDILIEEAGLYVVLRADLFCDWIGVKRKKSFKDLFKKK